MAFTEAQVAAGVAELLSRYQAITPENAETIVCLVLQAVADQEPSPAEQMTQAAEQFSLILEMVNGQRLRCIELGFDEVVAQQMALGLYGTLLLKMQQS